MQNTYLSAWINEASEVPYRVQQLFEEMTEEHLNTKPSPDRWSIGELIDHIIVTNEQYFPILDKVIAGTLKTPMMGKLKGVPALFGNSILKSVEPNSEKKYKTIKKFQPVKRVFPLSKIEDFKVHQKRLIAYAKATDGVNHETIIIPSPATPLIVYSLQDAFKIILSHELRHINQAMKLKALKMAEQPEV